ncbi:MAG: RepB family protein [Terrimicrobiaceae bacterium]
MIQSTKSIQIDKQVHAELKQFCDEKGLKLQKLVERLIKDELSKDLRSNYRKS